MDRTNGNISACWFWGGLTHPQPFPITGKGVLGSWTKGPTKNPIPFPRIGKGVAQSVTDRVNRSKTQ